MSLPLLPLRGMLVFPGMITTLEVGRARSVRACEEAVALDGQMVLVAQRVASVDEPGADDLYTVGARCAVKQLMKTPDSQMVRILVEGIERVRIVRFTQLEPCLRVDAEVQPAPAPGERTAPLARTLMRQFEQFVKLSKKVPQETFERITAIERPDRLADAVAAQLSVELEQKQSVLERTDPMERLECVLGLLHQELEILELERRIAGRVRKQMERTQKEYYLREQLKAIQKELGHQDDQKAEAEEWRERIEAAKLPDAVDEKAQHELKRLERMPPLAAEGGVIRTYLDWLVALPWTELSEDRHELPHAREILESDHYGLEKPKERILEYLAVRQLAPALKGPILCLSGPPGVGKTSLGQSIARALGRQFVRLSLGGVRDEAEIRGHRRTYVGAMPGRIIQAMRQAKTANPVMLLDEIDKMSTDFRGDPAAALLEVLDPEQNHAFSDHYLELPFDLSRVLFITTANVWGAIPRPLRDRMELIEISGYTELEKLHIAQGHLLPKQLAAHGLGSDQLIVSENAVAKVIEGYTREAGVRNLERELAGICRKAARQIVEGQPPPVRITMANLERLLGPIKFRRSRLDGEDRVGVATGLVYTAVGGDTLTIEASIVKGKGRVQLTGKLGEVMRESAQAAFSYIRAHAARWELPQSFPEHIDVHVHVPEGAVPKEGPSAGITMATALVSALTIRPVRKDVAMTGEVTLHGRVLPIGGLKEKLIAADRAGLAQVIIPKENAIDLDELPVEVRRRLKIQLVESVDEVLEIALQPAAERGEEAEAAPPPFVPQPESPAGWEESFEGTP